MNCQRCTRPSPGGFLCPPCFAVTSEQLGEDAAEMEAAGRPEQAAEVRRLAAINEQPSIAAALELVARFIVGQGKPS